MLFDENDSRFPWHRLYDHGVRYSFTPKDDANSSWELIEYRAGKRLACKAIIETSPSGRIRMVTRHFSLGARLDVRLNLLLQDAYNDEAEALILAYLESMNER